MDIPFKAGVAQLGARMHYAVPAAFQRSGSLACLSTDLWYPKLLHPIRLLLSKLQPKTNARMHAGIPVSVIKHHPVLAFSYARALRYAHDRSTETAVFLHYSRKFASLAANDLQGCSLIYGFNSAFLEIAQTHHKRCFLVVEQTLAPRIIERKLLGNLPGHPSDMHSLEYEAREAAEWEAADLVVCGSAFVRDGLLKQGVPDNKICVVQYGVSLPVLSSVRVERTKNQPLRLLFIGNGALRKGLPDVLDAMQKLPPGSATLTVAGDLHLPHGFALPPSSSCVFIGSVPRQDIPTLLAKHDVFVLPSLCEGSATVTYEALQAGLPVICTENTGSVVEHGKDGFIVPIRDPEAIAASIQKYFDFEVLKQHAEAARAKGRLFTEENYGDRLLRELTARYLAWKGYDG